MEQTGEGLEAVGGPVWPIVAVLGLAAAAALVGSLVYFLRQRSLLRRVYERSPQPMLVISGPSARIISANSGACRLYGYEPDEWSGMLFAKLRSGSEANPLDKDSVTSLMRSPSAMATWDHRRKDGTRIDVEVTGFLDGYPTRDARVVALRDVTAARSETASKRAMEEALRVSEARYRRVVEGIDIISWEMSLAECRFTFVSEPAERILGFPVEAWYATDFWSDHVDPEDLGGVMAFCESATTRGEDHVLEYRMIAADGRRVWIRDLVTVVMRDGRAHSLRGAMIDVTAEKRALIEVEESKRRYLAIVDAHPDLICRFTEDSTLTFVNDAYAAFFGNGSPKELVNVRFCEFLEPDDRARIGREIQALASDPATPRTKEQAARGSSGEVRWFSWHNSVVQLKNGRGVEFQGVGRDITALTEARLAVLRRDAILRTVADTAGSVLSARRWDEALPGLLEKLGAAAGASRLSLFALTNDAETPARIVRQWNAASPASPHQSHATERPILGEDVPQGQGAEGRERTVPVLAGDRAWGSLSALAADNRPEWTEGEIDALRSFAGLLGAFMQRERMVEHLRASDEQLRQSQKLEAVGQLASGVAHDFNNLLTAIQGYVGLAKTTLPANHPAIESLEQVEEASRQATGVAHALLTFTRRGTSQRRPVELGSVIEPALKLLRRTLPASIDLRMEPSATDVWVNADPTQLQQVILNLTINARDAMEGGGQVRVRVEASEPGEAAIVVSDDGIGMSEAVQARLYEPFFTTKPKGAGTGLGLSIVHGIISEHGGRIVVRSEPGRGSVFRVVLPRVPAPPEGPTLLERSVSLARGSVLVVEDDALVRGLICSMLTSLGFESAAAATAAAADTLADSGSFVAALIDIELPDRNGAEMLAGWRRQGRMFPAVLVTGLADGTGLSGHTKHGRRPGESGSDSEGVGLGEYPLGVAVLQKPFRLNDLRDVLTTILGSGKSPNTATDDAE